MDHVSNGPVCKEELCCTCVEGWVYKYEAATIDQPASSTTHSATDQSASASLLSSCAVVIIAMAKEEELKRVDLKVNVSCCDGCRRKVMKAMSLKGVLRTEIHPSLDRVTVVGNVDTKVLIKKLAKVGKIAEVAVIAAADKQLKKREGDGHGDGGKDRDGGGDKPAGAEKSKPKDGGKDNMGDKPASASSKNKDCHKCAHQQSARGDDAAADYGHGKAPSTKDGAGSAFKEEGDGFAGGERSAPVNAPAAHHHYNRAEPPSMAVPIHMPYYEPANLTAPSYYAPPNVAMPSYYGPPNVAPPPYYGGGYYAMPPPMPTMPMPWRPAQQQQRQVSRFDVDYFNEDNTAGCRVM